MIMKCKKQFIALFMAISVIFCVGSQSYIKAEALEWAIPTITAGEAIKWLLGLLGVTVAGAAIADTDYEQLAENYTEYAHQQGLSAVETGKFWSDVIDGTLDQGSQAWSTFKEWVSSLFATTSDFSTLSSFANYYNYTFDYSNVSNYNDFTFNFITANNGVPGTSTMPVYINFYNVTKVNVSSVIEFYHLDSYFYAYKQSDNTYKIYSSNGTMSRIDNSASSLALSYSLGIDFNITGSYTIRNPIFNYDFSGSLSQDFLSYNNTLINNLGLIVSNAISDAIPDVIPLPWDQVSDTAEGINDKINELIEKVNEGVLSLEDYMIAIQSILGVIAFDTTNDLVIPSDPDLPDETIQDKINENVNNNGFVLSGLENFFPFCIPFDIYSFITILVAEPVAPVIHWHIYNPVTKTDNIMTLDFAVWEPVVILFRYIFDFLFIIGLALIARSLIGGDD